MFMRLLRKRKMRERCDTHKTALMRTRILRKRRKRHDAHKKVLLIAATLDTRNCPGFEKLGVHGVDVCWMDGWDGLLFAPMTSTC
jgi:hypothetical protein